MLILIAASTAVSAFAQPQPSQLLEQYRAQRIQWTTNVWPYANTLFGILATIEFAWSAAVMLLEKADLQSWTSALVRKIMWIGAFYALLLNGRVWIPAIIDSFEQIGETVSGFSGISPSAVFAQGINIAGSLMDSASTSAFFTNTGTCLAIVFAAVLIALAFCGITIQFIVAMVESYIIVAAGFVFLGFGGSRWTAPYVERYIGLGVSTGVKIMILYLLIGVGMNVSAEWITDAQQVSASPSPAMGAFGIMGSALIFLMLCWQIPKLFAAVLGGSPALTGGDLLATATGVAAGAGMVGSVVGASSRAVGGGVAAVSRAVSVGEGGNGSGASAAVSSLSAVNGSRSGAGSVNSNSRQPEPPVNGKGVSSNGGGIHRDVQPPVDAALGSVGGERLAGSGFEHERPAPGYATGPIVVPGSESSAGAGSTALSDPPAGSPVDPSPPTTPRGSGWTGGFLPGARRRRFNIVPSDAATHAQPPRMPIDHEE